MRDRSRRARGGLTCLWAALLVACLNPRPEEDPSYGGDPTGGEHTGSAGAAAGPDLVPGGAAGAGGSGVGAGGSGSGAQPPADDVAIDAGTEAGPDAGSTTSPSTDAGAPDAGPP